MRASASVLDINQSQHNQYHKKHSKPLFSSQPNNYLLSTTSRNEFQHTFCVAIDGVNKSILILLFLSLHCNNKLERALNGYTNSQLVNSAQALRREGNPFEACYCLHFSLISD